MNGLYILIGQTPVPIEADPCTPEGIRGLHEWAEWFENSRSERIVFQSKVLLGMVSVSTVFLGIDHAWMGGPPMLFETITFWGGDLREAYEMERCSTWLEAEQQHRRVCREVSRPRALATWVARAWAFYWKRARTTRR